MGHKVLKKAGKIEFVLISRKGGEQRGLQKLEDDFIRKEVTKGEPDEEADEAAHEAGLQFI